MARLADRMNHLGTETAFEVMARANALEAEGREIINLVIELFLQVLFHILIYFTFT